MREREIVCVSVSVSECVCTQYNLGAKWIKAIKHFVVFPFGLKRPSFGENFDPDRIKQFFDRVGSIQF